MKRFIVVAILVCSQMLVIKAWANEMSLIDRSRNSAVKVVSESGNSKGTGFFISEKHIVTCLHVISKITTSQGVTNLKIFNDIKVTTSAGEIIDATCITVPTNEDLSPIEYDFAILELSSSPEESYSILDLANDTNSLKVGSKVTFSGYPLASPAMITHQGMISGIDADGAIICIQAAINKGNSGGALMSADAQVIGIVSMREGGISKGLQELSEHIEVTSSQGTVRMMGVDPLQSIRALISTLNTYISTGIGYARNIMHVNDYLIDHPELIKNT